MRRLSLALGALLGLVVLAAVGYNAYFWPGFPGACSVDDLPLELRNDIDRASAPSTTSACIQASWEHGTEYYFEPVPHCERRLEEILRQARQRENVSGDVKEIKVLAYCYHGSLFIAEKPFPFLPKEGGVEKNVFSILKG